MNVNYDPHFPPQNPLRQLGGLRLVRQYAKVEGTYYEYIRNDNANENPNDNEGRNNDNEITMTK